PPHQYMDAAGPAPWAQAASLASTAARDSSIASARESVVVCTWRYCTSRSAMAPDRTPPQALVRCAARRLTAARAARRARGAGAFREGPATLLRRRRPHHGRL